ncbi:MAG: hypothetical protein PHX83_09970 [Acidobacteriia bacterium]|nr:hypothetical protein [Terriglobia bacterium]
MEPRSELHWADRWKRLNAWIFIACGVVVVWRSWGRPGAWLAVVTGAILAFFGVYRLNLYHRALNGTLKPPSLPRRAARPRM